MCVCVVSRINNYISDTFLIKLIFFLTKNTGIVFFLVKHCTIKTDIISLYSLNLKPIELSNQIYESVNEKTKNK